MKVLRNVLPFQSKDKWVRGQIWGGEAYSYITLLPTPPPPPPPPTPLHRGKQRLSNVMQ